MNEHHSIALAGPAAGRTSFGSILLPGTEPKAIGNAQAPDCFEDLNLDQVVSAVVAGYQDYGLAPLFQSLPVDLDTIRYRQEVMRDLEDEPLRRLIASFTACIREIRVKLAASEKSSYAHEAQRGFLEAARRYVAAMRELSGGLAARPPHSHGLRAFAACLRDSVADGQFARLETDAEGVVDQLAAVRYCLLIDGDAITVRPYEGEIDYGAAVERTFEKFRRDAVESYLSKFPAAGRLNHIDAQIVDRVARLNPGPFKALADFRTTHATFLDPAIARFEREVQFYLSYHAYIAPMRRAGLPFCYPSVSADSKEISASGAFDMALAAKRVSEGATVVGNDFYLRGTDRILLVSGPNQGGKTTFARMFGQMHYLAGLGCPVPGERAKLLMCDYVLTHFERQEDIRHLRGKLHEDLVRIRRGLDRSSGNSIAVMNEIFSSTTVEDALFLCRRILAQLRDRDMVGVFVTFLTELGAFDGSIVSMVASVDPLDPSSKTYRIERRAADGLAYALAVARKHRLTHDAVLERLAP